MGHIFCWLGRFRRFFNRFLRFWIFTGHMNWRLWKCAGGYLDCIGFMVQIIWRIEILSLKIALNRCTVSQCCDRFPDEHAAHSACWIVFHKLYKTFDYRCYNGFAHESSIVLKSGYSLPHTVHLNFLPLLCSVTCFSYIDLVENFAEHW